MRRRGRATFRLIAVIEHKGNSCQSGHYVAYVRRKRFVLPGPLPAAPCASQRRAEPPRGSACSPSELLKRIGLFRSSTLPVAHCLRHPNSPPTAPALGTSGGGIVPEGALKRSRTTADGEGSADDGTEVRLWRVWFAFVLTSEVSLQCRRRPLACSPPIPWPSCIRDS